MESCLNKEQLDFCWENANKVAKEILEKDISGKFDKNDGNANFALEVAVMFSADIIAIVSERINWDPESIADTFNERVKLLMKQKRKPLKRKLYILQ